MWLLVHATAWMISEHATSEIFWAKWCFLWPNDKLPHAWISINFCPLCFSYTHRCVACETYRNLYVTCQRTVCVHGPCMDVWRAMTLIGTIKQAMSEGAALIEYYYGIGYTSFIYWHWSVRKNQAFWTAQQCYNISNSAEINEVLMTWVQPNLTIELSILTILPQLQLHANIYNDNTYITVSFVFTIFETYV